MKFCDNIKPFMIIILFTSCISITITGKKTNLKRDAPEHRKTFRPELFQREQIFVEQRQYTPKLALNLKKNL